MKENGFICFSQIKMLNIMMITAHLSLIVKHFFNLHHKDKRTFLCIIILYFLFSFIQLQSRQATKGQLGPYFLFSILVATSQASK